MIKITKDILLEDAKKRGYQIETTDAWYPFDYAGNEAYLITNLKMERAYVCFDSKTGKVLAKQAIKGVSK